MSYCPSCGVEVEKRLRFCPLCENDLQEEFPEIEGEYPQHLTDGEGEQFGRSGAKRLWALMAVAILGAIAMTICAVVDIVQGEEGGWSPYVHISVLGLIGSLAVIFYLRDRSLLMFTALHLVVAVLVLSLNKAQGPLSWAITKGMPVILASFLIFGSWFYLTFRLKLAKSRTVVLFLVAVALFCLVLDWRYDMLPTTAGLSWSIPVTICLAAVALLVIVAVKIVQRNPSWKRKFDM
ncbi:MAG: hypothetical protein AAF226_16805 [Verrucomicrobiota bacterium]